MTSSRHTEDTMDCPQYEQLYDLLGNPNPDAEVADHAAFCPECAAELARMEAVLQKYGSDVSTAGQIPVAAPKSQGFPKRSWAAVLIGALSILAILFLLLPHGPQAIPLKIEARVAMMRGNTEPVESIQTHEDTMLVPERKGIWLAVKAMSPLQGDCRIRVISSQDGDPFLHPVGKEAGPFILQPGQTRQIYAITVDSPDVAEDLIDSIDFKQPRSKVVLDVRSRLSSRSQQQLGIRSIELKPQP